MSAGVYVIYGPNGVYVGESTNILGRDSYRIASLLGLRCEIVREFPDGTSRLERCRVESQVAQELTTAGHTVLSKGHSPRHIRYFKQIERKRCPTCNKCAVVNSIYCAAHKKRA